MKNMPGKGRPDDPAPAEATEAEATQKQTDDTSKMNGSSLVKGQAVPINSKGRGPTGIVTVVSLRMNGIDEVCRKCTTDVVAMLLATYSELLSRCVRDFHGHTISAEDDQHLVVFQQPWDALNCCLTVQTAFVATQWPESLLSCTSCSRIEEPKGLAGRTLVFNGPRIQIGVSRGKVDHEFDSPIGRTKYSGNELEVAAGIMSLAKGGQILVNTAAWSEVQRSQLSPCIHNDTGRHRIEKCEKKQRLYEVLPAALAERSKWFGTTCSNCGDKIRPDQGYIKALGRHWHLKHFRKNGLDDIKECLVEACFAVMEKGTAFMPVFLCCHCNNPLMDSYIVKDGMPYCLDDFFTLHARTCHGCDTIITGSYIEAMSNYWHPDCFVCQKCRRAPEGTENIYELNALPFCLKCYHEVANSVNTARIKAQQKQQPTKTVRPDEVTKHRAVIKS